VKRCFAKKMVCTSSFFYEAVQRWKRCGKASRTLAAYIKVSLYCFKLLSIFNTPFQIFVPVSKGVVGLLVMPVECQELSRLSPTGYHKHSNATDSSEFGVSLDIVGRI